MCLNVPTKQGRDHGRGLGDVSPVEEGQGPWKRFWEAESHGSRHGGWERFQGLSPVEAGQGGWEKVLGAELWGSREGIMDGMEGILGS